MSGRLLANATRWPSSVGLALLLLGIHGCKAGGRPAKPTAVDAVADDICETAKVCGLESACASGTGCYMLTSCGDEPRCVTQEDACALTCGTPRCAVAESYPMQPMCE